MQALTKRPLFTKIVTGIVGTIIGDAVAQISSHAMAPRARISSSRSNLMKDTPLASKQQRRSTDIPGKDADKAPSGGVGAPKSCDSLTGEADADYETRLPFKYNFQRLFRLCLCSALIGTPLGHTWFGFLDKAVYPLNPTCTAAVLTKLALDQLVMAPVGLSIFLFANKMLETADAGISASEVGQKVRPLVSANYLLWPAANFINFKFVPPEQRILYINIIAVGWTAVLSHISHKPAEGSHKAA
ncbi:MAG: hypothetical protein WDW38_004690 [Sanguina aurantia]